MHKSGSKPPSKVTKVKSHPLLKRDQSIKELHLEALQKPKSLLMVHYKDKRLSIPIFEECNNGEAFLTRNLSRFEKEILGSNSLQHLRSIVGYRSRDRDPLKDYYFHARKDISIFKLLQVEPIWKSIQTKKGLGRYEFLRCLYRGKATKVYMARHMTTGRFQALKLIRKDTVSSSKAQMIRSQESSLKMVENQFIIRLQDSFQTGKYIVLCMQYCHGGSLQYHLNKQKHLSELETKFYALELLMAVEKLHGSKIVHQNIKVSSILLDVDGHLKLTGFGHSMYKLLKKSDMAQNQSGSGGSEKQQSGYMLDYYCVGKLCFELLTGYPTSDRGSQDFPSGLELSREAKAFVKELMHPNSNARLGSLNGVKEILNHSWLRNSNLQRLIQRVQCAPIQPTLLAFHNDQEQFDRNQTKLFSKQEQVYPKILPLSLDSESDQMKPMRSMKSPKPDNSMKKSVNKKFKKETRNDRRDVNSSVLRKTSNKKITINIQISKKREVEIPSRTLTKNKSQGQLAIKKRLKKFQC